MQNIRIRGARTHNLKNIDLDLPRDRLIVFTGLSGSGKSSLAFDTIYAEGQRRYVESLSTYARQFLSMMEKPDIDTIEGLSPAISIEQKSTSHNPRSTVGTVTEIYDYLRLLYARAGTPRCPDHHIDLAAQTVSQMVDAVLQQPEGTALMLLAPAIAERKGEHAELIEELQAGGFVRARIDGKVVELDQAPKLDVRRKHTVEAIVDRFKVRPDLSQRLAESFETALRLGQGVARVAYMDDPERAELVFSNKFACPICNYSLSELEPRLFSFNSPIGACPACDGLGTQDFFDPEKIVANPHLSLAGGAVRGWDRRNAYYFQLIQSLARHTKFDIEAPFESLPQKIRDLVLFGSDEVEIEFKYLDGKGGTVKRKHTFEGIVRNLERRYKETESATVREELAKYRSSRPCPECGGTRLNRAARNVFVDGQSIPAVSSLSVARALEFFAQLKLKGWRGEIAVKIVKEIGDRLGFLGNVGLGYLTLNRSADTLSGGEAQRIRLASQIGSGLVGVMYILDEPSIGLHQRDNQRLLDTLVNLRDLGNTVIVVEHDEDAIRQADHVVEHRRPGHGRRSRRPSRFDYRPIPERPAPHRDSGEAACTRSEAHAAGDRGYRQQPEKSHGGIPAGIDDLRHGRVRLRKIHPGKRHPVSRGRHPNESCLARDGALRSHRRARIHRSGHRNRPKPDRPYASFQSCHLHRAVRADSRDLRRRAGIAGPRL